MTYQVIFDGEAEAELDEATAWYSLREVNLGQKFSRAVRTVLRQAAKDPQPFILVGPTTRKAKILGWPYSIYFTLLEDSLQLIVVSVFHGARNPAELRSRLK